MLSYIMSYNIIELIEKKERLKFASDEVSWKKKGVPTHATDRAEMIDKKRKEKEGVTRYPCNVTGRTLGVSFLKATQTPPSVEPLSKFWASRICLSVTASRRLTDRSPPREGDPLSHPAWWVLKSSTVHPPRPRWHECDIPPLSRDGQS
jgi:hypothetical protein